VISLTKGIYAINHFELDNKFSITRDETTRSKRNFWRQCSKNI